MFPVCFIWFSELWMSIVRTLSTDFPLGPILKPFIFHQRTRLQSILTLPSASRLTVGLAVTIQVVRAATVRCRLPTVTTCASCPSRESRHRAHTVAEVHWFVCGREVHGLGLLLYGPRANETGANRNRLGRVHRAGGTTVQSKSHILCQSAGHAHLLQDFQPKLPSININHQRRYIWLLRTAATLDDQNLNNGRGNLKTCRNSNFCYFLLSLQPIPESYKNLATTASLQILTNASIILQQYDLICTNKITRSLVMMKRCIFMYYRRSTRLPSRYMT
jgi:hypothetical protein